MGWTCQSDLIMVFITAQESPCASPMPTSAAMTPNVAYSIASIAVTALRRAPSILSIADSRKRLNLVEAMEPERMNSPAAMANPDIKSTRVVSLATVDSMVLTISRVLKAVMLGRASTMACCSCNSLASGTWTVAT